MNAPDQLEFLRKRLKLLQAGAARLEKDLWATRGAAACVKEMIDELEKPATAPAEPPASPQ